MNTSSIGEKSAIDTDVQRFISEERARQQNIRPWRTMLPDGLDLDQAHVRCGGCLAEFRFEFVNWETTPPHKARNDIRDGVVYCSHCYVHVEKNGQGRLWLQRRKQNDPPECSCQIS